MTDKQLILFYLINGFGGLCVLGSYVHGLITNPSIRGELWGAIPDSLKITAIAEDDGEIMGVSDKKYLIEGVQFHPESIMTDEGNKILENQIISH